MWILKIAILAVGITVTAFAANSSPYSARCAAGETVGEAGASSGKRFTAERTEHSTDARACGAG